MISEVHPRDWEHAQAEKEALRASAESGEGRSVWRAGPEVERDRCPGRGEVWSVCKDPGTRTRRSCCWAVFTSHPRDRARGGAARSGAEGGVHGHGHPRSSDPQM